MNAAPFQAYQSTEILPGPEVQTDDQLRRHILDHSATISHPIGTGKTGNDDVAVVDARLRVRGIARLRVADVSIMPTITSGNTNAPTIMIGEKANDLIKEDAQT